MFAAGRILRNNRRLSSIPQGGGLLAPARVRRKERRKFRCYMPFMWSALMMACAGLGIILTGIAMCFVGYYLGPFGSTSVVASDDRSDAIFEHRSNSTSTDGPSTNWSPMAAAVSHEQSTLQTYRGLIYAGPVVMSFGCFAIVFACVIVCETRDRALETMDDRVRRGLSELPPGGLRPDFYTLVIEHRLLRLEKQRQRRRQRQEEAEYGEQQPHGGGGGGGNGDQTSVADCDHSTNANTNCFSVDGLPSSLNPAINIFSNDGKDATVAETGDADRLMCQTNVDSCCVDVERSKNVERVDSDRLPLCNFEKETQARLTSPQVGQSSAAHRWKSVPYIAADSGSDVLYSAALAKSLLLLHSFHYVPTPPATSLLRNAISGASLTPTTTRKDRKFTHSTCSVSSVSDASLTLPSDGVANKLSTPPPPISEQSQTNHPTVLVHAASVHASVDADSSENRCNGDNLPEMTPFTALTVGESGFEADSDIMPNDATTSAADLAQSDVIAQDFFNLTTLSGPNDADNHNTRGSCSEATSTNKRSSSEDMTSNDTATDDVTSEQDIKFVRSPVIGVDPTNINTEWPICRPTVDIETRLEQPSAATERRSSAADDDDDERCNGPSPKHRRIFAVHRPVIGPSLADNVSNRFRRRRRILDSSTVDGRCVSGGGDRVHTCVISSITDNKRRPANSEQLKWPGESDSGPGAANDLTVTAVSSLNDSHSTAAKSSSSPVAASQPRRLHQSLTLTAAPRHYLSRIRMWKGKRPLASSTGSSLVKSQCDMSQSDHAHFPVVCNGGQPANGQDSPAAAPATPSGQRLRAGRRHRYRLPALNFSASKTRLPKSRGRLKRTTSSDGSVVTSPC